MAWMCCDPASQPHSRQVVQNRHRALLFALAQQPNLTPGLFRASHGDSAIRLALLRNPRSSVWMAHDLRKECVERYVPQNSGSYSFSAGLPEGLTTYLFLLSVPRLPVDADFTRLRHGGFLTRLALAERHLSSRSRRDHRLLRRLANDPNRYVRAAARERL